MNSYEMASVWVDCFRFFNSTNMSGMNEGSRGEMIILKMLMNEHEAMNPGQLAQEMKVTPARITTLLNSLEDKQLIRRYTKPGDRRRIYVELSPTGREYTEKRQEEVLSRIVKMVEFLGQEDAETFTHLLRRLEGFVHSQTYSGRNNLLY